jgi:Arc/MetJ-type ribon-helix-helix transcriptional regulator
MTTLIHIRVGKELKKQMQELIDLGLFSNQAEVAREGIRRVLLKYKIYKTEKARKKNEDDN